MKLPVVADRVRLSGSRRPAGHFKLTCHGLKLKNPLYGHEKPTEYHSYVSFWVILYM